MMKPDRSYRNWDLFRAEYNAIMRNGFYATIQELEKWHVPKNCRGIAKGPERKAGHRYKKWAGLYKGNLSRRKTYFLGRIYGAHWGDPEGAAGVSVLLYRAKKRWNCGRFVRTRVWDLQHWGRISFLSAQETGRFYEGRWRDCRTISRQGCWCGTKHY